MTSKEMAIVGLLGIGGGCMLVAAEAATSWGPVVLFPYIALVAALVVFLRRTRPLAFVSRALLGATGVFLGTIVLLAYVRFVDNPAIQGRSGTEVFQRATVFLIGFAVVGCLIAIASHRPGGTETGGHHA